MWKIVYFLDNAQFMLSMNAIGQKNVHVTKIHMQVDEIAFMSALKCSEWMQNHFIETNSDPYIKLPSFRKMMKEEEM